MGVMTLRALLSVLVLVAVPQGKTPTPAEGFPFSVWLDHKEVTQIPWTFVAGRPRLRSDGCSRPTNRASLNR